MDIEIFANVLECFMHFRETYSATFRRLLKSALTGPRLSNELSGELCVEGAVGGSGLEVRVATKVCTFDEDVGHGALSGHLLKGILDFLSVGDLIQLDGLESNSSVVEELLGCAGEGAERLGVDHDIVAVDIGLDLTLEGFDHRVIMLCRLTRIYY